MADVAEKTPTSEQTTGARTNGAQGYLDELDRYWSLAKVLPQSGLLPAGLKRPAQALAVMLKGRELGIPPCRRSARSM